MLLAGLLCLLLFAPALLSAAEGVDYQRQVKPLLVEKCGACHGALRQKGELRLDAGSLIVRGGESGPAIKPGRSAESLLIARVTAEVVERMPPEGEGKPLTPAEVELLRSWIDTGAKFPANEPIAHDPRSHWAFQVPVRPELPPIAGTPTANLHDLNPLDRFISAELIHRGLTAQPPASRELLLRRVYLDLIGLPPSREELHSFLADDSPDAYERVVEELLNRPEHAERWARHWMDVWRYCDWHGSGNEIRYSQRHLWRWRDWIVRSLAADMGYDQMIVAMLAGDELSPNDPAEVVATGFIGRNWYKFDRQVWLREVVEHTAVGFLGLTMKCARCHDHKYDPVSQEEYYRLRAFFEPHDVRTDSLSPAPEVESFVDAGAPVLKDGVPRVYDKTLDAPTHLFVRGDDRLADKSRSLAPGVPAVVNGIELSITPVSLPLTSYAPGLAPARVREWQQLLTQKVQTAQKALASSPQDMARQRAHAIAKAEQASVEARLAADRARHLEKLPEPQWSELAKTAARQEREWKLLVADDALIQAELAAKGAREASQSDDPAQQATAKTALDAAEKRVTAAKQAVDSARAALAKNDAAYTPVGPIYPETSTGRRSALAQWIASRGNPLTARVAVNQIWLRHFGRALVEPVSDFGLRAKPPSHPQLLDWLAVEFMDHGWSMKHLHRLIVTSSAYRRSSATSSDTVTSDANVRLDRENRYLWRMNARRLEAEAVRDSVLSAAGLLDRAIGGREIPFNQDESVLRRSLYFQTAPNRQTPFLELFDSASTEECYARQSSVIPQQALVLLNSQLVQRAASVIGQRVGKVSPSEPATPLFETILSRTPTPAERTRCESFLAYESQRLAAQERLDPPAARLRALQGLAEVLFNHHEFVTVR